MLKLANKYVVGSGGEHRSGWPYCIDALSELLHTDAQVLLDDFCERTFLYPATEWQKDHIPIYKDPWVGILHHPPDIPDWYVDNAKLSQLASNRKWIRSLRNLRLIITLGGHLKKWVNKTWPHIPCVTIKHPTGQPLACWDPTKFIHNTEKQLIQIGWFLRNTESIYRVKPPEHITRTHIKITKPCALYAQNLCKRKDPRRTEPRVPGVSVINPINDLDYDILLSKNIVFVDLIAAVANNTVVECIARNTPICVNRHPGPEYYLGEDYPLFYDHLDEVPKLLEYDNIIKAHNYLKNMDKWWIHGTIFKEQVKDACIRHVEELKNYSVNCSVDVDNILI